MLASDRLLFCFFLFFVLIYLDGLSGARIMYFSVRSASVVQTADELDNMKKKYIYISEVGGLRPTGKTFRFVRACARSCM